MAAIQRNPETRRNDGTAYLHEVRARSKWEVFFAVRLAAQALTRVTGDAATREQIGALADMAGVLRGLWMPERDVALELRLIAGKRDAVEFVLRGRASHPSLKEARRIAGDLLKGLMTSLDSLGKGQRWDVVSDRKAYELLAQPFKIKDSAELTRRHGFLRLDAEENPGESPERDSGPDGPRILDEAPTPGSVFLVRPFIPVLDCWPRLCKALLKHGRPLMLSIAAAPTRLAEHERRFLVGQAALCDGALEQSGPEHRTPAARPLRPMAAGLRQMLSTTIEALSDTPFLLNIRLASAVALPETLIGAVGAALFAPAGAMDPRYKACEEYAQALRGGFRRRRPADAAERIVMARNLGRIGFDPSHAAGLPADARRLPWLVAAVEAACCLRVPTPADGPLAGIRTNRSRTVSWAGTASQRGLLLGHAASNGKRVPVLLSEDDSRRHMYILGQTGTGKTSLLLAMAMQDIRSGAGVCVLDPHGDLVERILPNIPAERAGDVIMADMGEERHPVGLNVLQHNGCLERDRIINMIFDMFDLLYHRETMGPVFELYMRTALMLVMSGDANGTLVDVNRVFLDTKYRDRMLAAAREPYVREAWEQVIVVAGGELSLQNVVPYVISKLNMFIHNHVMRAIISQPKSTIVMRQVLTERKILLVDLAKGKLGSRFSSFLGMVLAGQLLREVRAGGKDRHKGAAFRLYVDEFQNVATPSFIEMLSETRKFGLSVVVANQYLHQVPEQIRQAILGNVGSFLSFRVGPEDAELVEKCFAPEFDQTDLLNLPVGQACASLLLEGLKAPAFSLETLWERSDKEAEAPKCRDTEASRPQVPKATDSGEAEAPLARGTVGSGSCEERVIQSPR
jgi:hypothetical protein